MRFSVTGMGWSIAELQGGKVVGEESLWKEYKDYDTKNALLSQADFVRNIRSNELNDLCD